MPDATPRTPLPQVKQSCETCRFWEAWECYEDSPITGDCRRYAPRPYRRDGRSSIDMTNWPNTSHDDWCGEWVGTSPPNLGATAAGTPEVVLTPSKKPNDQERRRKICELLRQAGPEGATLGQLGSAFRGRGQWAAAKRVLKDLLAEGVVELITKGNGNPSRPHRYRLCDDREPAGSTGGTS